MDGDGNEMTKKYILLNWLLPVAATTAIGQIAIVMVMFCRCSRTAIYYNTLHHQLAKLWTTQSLSHSHTFTLSAAPARSQSIYRRWPKFSMARCAALYYGLCCIHFQNYCTLLLVYIMMFEFWVLYKFYWSSGNRLRHTPTSTCVCVWCVQKRLSQSESRTQFRECRTVKCERTNKLHRFSVK